MTNLFTHPFKAGVLSILQQHFEDRIVDKFVLLFEAQIYTKESPNILKQMRDDCPILEVLYKTNEGTTEYICDVYPWDSRKMCEYRLLRFITDKIKAGKIGSDWTERHGRMGISNEILSGDYETKE